MKEILINFLDNYIENKNNQTSHSAKNFRKVLKNDSENTFKDILRDDLDKYDIECSFGQAIWSNIPWIKIKSTDYENSATKDYFVVYLFNVEMNGVYLSLNQGVTSFKNLCDDDSCYKKVRGYWLRGLNKYLVDFDTDIELTNNKDHVLARKYEKCHIFGKFYSKDNIPDNNILMNDLIKMLNAYEDLRCNLINDSAEDTNKHILNLFATFEDSSNKYKINNEKNFPKSNQFVLKDRDYVNELKKNIKIGKDGEFAVLVGEKSFLSENGREDLSKKVKHI